MNKPKFTKGPWRVLDNTGYDDREYFYQILDKAGYNIANIEDCEEDEERANAVLIAAAPEMYELLEWWLHEATWSMNIHFSRWIRAGLDRESLLRDVNTKNGIENIRRTKQLLRRIRGEA